MSFDNEKKMALQKPDKSSAGKLDTAIQPVCTLLNASQNYYTTSSCSGRIVIMSESGTHDKHTAHWLLVSHQPIDVATILELSFPDTEIWFRQEGMILHVACRTCKDAFQLVHTAQKTGLKRSGVISSANKIMVEILDTEKLELPIGVHGKLVVSPHYLELIIEKANTKLRRTHKKIKYLEKNIKKLLALNSY
ncbi:MAG: tRNA wybutosine-synthesizing 3 family protein [Candidatus Methanofastidiosia archaeon]|jgi:tRNA wybutosine-synthesizing protein 3